MSKLLSNAPKIPLSDEQKAAFDYAMNGEGVAVDSCAGSGKSHTARAIAVSYDGKVESIPFSRSLADAEIAYFQPYHNITSLNFHRRGLHMLPAGMEMDNRKCHNIAAQIDGEHAEALGELVTKMKAEAFGTWANALTLEQICIKYGFKTELIPNALLVLEASDKCTKLFDYGDMLRLPVLRGKQSFLGGLIILDEVQDYTPDAYVFLTSCLVAKSSQVVMIGDSTRQCLQQFTGANPELFNIMAEYFNCQKVEFTVNRRCAKSIVEAASFKGNMQPLEDAPMGIVGLKSMQETFEGIQSGAFGEDCALLCEANAPLVKFGITLLSKGVPVQMRAVRLSKMIMRYAFKFLDNRKFPVGTAAPAFMAELNQLAANGEDISEAKDVGECIQALENYCLAKEILKPKFEKIKGKWHVTAPIMIALKEMVDSKVGITLMTGHTSKGLEWNTVFHLPGKTKAPEQDWQVHQANCVLHVIQTRARLEFYTLF